MESRQLTLELFLCVEKDSLTGHARSGEGPEEQFTGRLGLIRAIDVLMERGGDAAPAPDPKGTR